MTALSSVSVADEQRENIDQVKVRVLPDGRMTRADAAHYLGVEPKTMANWACQGKGPRAHRLMGRNFYYKADLDALLQDEAGADDEAA